MCGIAGFSGSFDRGLLDRMGRLIRHRGPDDGDQLLLPREQIGLVHRRLSIIDLSPRGRQPMWDATESVVIIYNGELFNYRELKQDLQNRGYCFRNDTDTEVLLNLYLDRGVDMLADLNGMFAFAIWDTRTRELFLARDGVGVKPLYYTSTPQGFLFASEMKALLACPEVSREISPAAVRNHLVYLWSPAPDTMLRDVEKLPPGQALLVREGRVARRWRFYDLPYDQPIASMTPDDAAKELQGHLREAVRRQLVGDVEVGAFLSGGLDSSAVVAMARDLEPDRPMQCFTIGFSEPELVTQEGFSVDLPYAERVAKHLGVKLHTIHVGSEMLDELESMIYYLDEPQADPAPLNALFICRLARERGIKVLLSGAGGDDILGGYRRHYALQMERWWSWLPHSARWCLARAAGHVPASMAAGRRLSKAFQYADQPPDARVASYFRWLPPALERSLYSPRLQAELGGLGLAAPLDRSLGDLSEDVPVLNRMLYLDARHFLADHNLNYTDRMSMAEGVEARVPLLDPDLIAFAARLPLSLKQNGRVGKWIFKKAMEPYLPADVIYRPKAGFGAPVRSWLSGILRPLVNDVLSPETIRRRGLFDPEGVQKLIELDRSGRVYASYPIFAMVCMELWCQRYLDHGVAAERAGAAA